MIEIKDAANAPWPEVQRVFNMMQSFEVQDYRGKEFAGPIGLELDDSRHLVIKQQGKPLPVKGPVAREVVGTPSRSRAAKRKPPARRVARPVVKVEGRITVKRKPPAKSKAKRKR